MDYFKLLRSIFISLPYFIIFISCNSSPSASRVAAAEFVDSNIITLTDAQRNNLQLSYTTLARQPLSVELKTNGVIEVPPQHIISISAPLGGYVKKIYLLPGNFVKAGDILAEIEDKQYIQLQEDYLLAQHKLTYLEKEHQRQKNLNAIKATSDKIFQQVDMEYQSQIIICKSLAEKLKFVGINPKYLDSQSLTKVLKIVASTDAVVSKINVNVGKYITPTEPLIELISLEDVHLTLKVFEEDVRQLSIGQYIKAYSNSDTTNIYKAKIITISKDIDTDKSISVHCHFNQYPKHLLPGTYMNAIIDIKNESMPVLPESSIIHTNNNTYVFIQKSNNIFLMQRIDIIQKNKQWVAIKNIADIEGKTIVNKGAYDLLMALKNIAE